MSKPERRNQIIETIKNSASPVSASMLAAQLNVSRQIIVGDIALLRASGHNISATPKGYVFENEENLSVFGYTGIIACRHDEKKLVEELYAIVDFGGTVIDVTIEHSTYGQISGRLDITSRHDVDEFRIFSANSMYLSTYFISSSVCFLYNVALDIPSSLAMRSLVLTLFPCLLSFLVIRSFSISSLNQA